MRLLKLLVFAASIGFVAVIFLGFSGDSPRVRVLSRKLTGGLPTLSVSDTIAAVLPRQFLTSVGPVLAGEVSVIRRDDSGVCSVLWGTPIGPIWGNEGDGDALSFIIYEQLVSRNYQNSSVSIQPGDVVFDVGGHLGTFTRAALNSGASTVITIEPAERNIQCFTKTFEAEIREGKVRLVEAAAWYEPGTLKFSADPNGHEAARGQVDDEGEVEVQAVTLDGLASSLGLEKVDFIKMDIEGAERHALNGALGVLAKHKPRMALCTYHLPDDPEVIEGIVSGANSAYGFTRLPHYLYCH